MEEQRRSVCKFLVILVDIVVISAIFATMIKGILNKAATEDFIIGAVLCFVIILMLAAVNDKVFLGAHGDTGFVLTFTVMYTVLFVCVLVVVAGAIYLLFKWFKWLIA